MALTTIDGNLSKSERTQKKIIKAYLEMMETKRWDKISVKELCQKIDITRGTFYQYYSDIFELMDQIQNALMEDIESRYQKLSFTPQNSSLIHDFLNEYDCEPPEMFCLWFEFCREQRDAIKVLLHPINGDPYFEQKLKHFLNKYLVMMMDNDGLPKDGLRSYFVSACSELHLVTLQSWLAKDCMDSVPVSDIIKLLNTVRIGSAYLIYKSNMEESAPSEKEENS